MVMGMAWAEIVPKLREAAKRERGTQKRLALRFDLRDDEVTRIMKGTQVPDPVLGNSLVKELLGLSLSQLLGETPAPAASPVTIGEDVVLPVPCVAVNVSAGPGAPWTEYPSKGPRHYFYRKSFVRRAIGLKITDPDPDWSRFQTVILDRSAALARSMMPTIQPGAMLLVDNGYDTGRLEPRTICFVNLAEKPGERLVAVKRVTVTDHVCVLESDNYTEPEFFPVIRHVGKNIRDLVLGVVLEWSTRARIEDPEKPADESNDPPA